jgi:hypothetical protein
MKRLATLGSFVKINIFGYLFHTKTYVLLNFDKKWVGPKLGRFFTNSLGHRDPNLCGWLQSDRKI